MLLYRSYKYLGPITNNLHGHNFDDVKYKQSRSILGTGFVQDNVGGRKPLIDKNIPAVI